MLREHPGSLFFNSFPLTYRKLLYSSVYRSCCCMGILISSLYSNVVLANGLYVWVSILTMWSSKIGSSLMFRISSQMLRTANPKDFKNVTFDVLSFFFFCLLQLDERVLSSCNVTGLVKNALSLCIRSIPFSISRSRYHCHHRIHRAI